MIFFRHGDSSFVAILTEKRGKKQGRIHGNPVADGWAGAVMRKRLGIQKCDGPTDGPTYQLTRQGVESRVRD